MVKIAQPLMSFSASGSIAKFLTFSKRNSGQQVRWQKKQIDQESAKRLIQRNKFLSASNSIRFYEMGSIILGNCVLGVDIDDFNFLAKNTPLSGYNLGIKKVIDYF
jgi:hypothetical protein